LPLTVAGSRLDAFEQASLGVMRFMASSLATPQSQHWREALHLAAHAWGPVQVPALAFGLLNVLDAMRMTRKPMFRFSNPACPECRLRLSQHERQLMFCIAHARRNRRTALNADATILCCGEDPTMFVQAVDRFVAGFGLKVFALG
jgi:hypothetical protein